jgi:hypothetical protein
MIAAIFWFVVGFAAGLALTWLLETPKGYGEQQIEDDNGVER